MNPPTTMLSIMLIIAAVLVAGLLYAISRRPDTFRVERSTTIDASASAIFPHVNGSRVWEPWSPWVEQDPEATYVYEGPASGVGATTRFAGRKSGVGTVTIVESRPNEVIRFRLDMDKPFKVSNDVVFTFVSADGKTRVTWAMSGPCNFVGKAMGLFLNCDEMCGRAFARGLANLKRVVEAERQGAVPAGSS